MQSTGNLAVNPWRVAALVIFNPGGGQPQMVFQDPVSGSAEVLTQAFPVYVDLSGANSWVIAGPH